MTKITDILGPDVSLTGCVESLEDDMYRIEFEHMTHPHVLVGHLVVGRDLAIQWFPEIEG